MPPYQTLYSDGTNNPIFTRVQKINIKIIKKKSAKQFQNKYLLQKTTSNKKHGSQINLRKSLQIIMLN